MSPSNALLRLFKMCMQDRLRKDISFRLDQSSDRSPEHSATILFAVQRVNLVGRRALVAVGTRGAQPELPALVDDHDCLGIAIAQETHVGIERVG